MIAYYNFLEHDLFEETQQWPINIWWVNMIRFRVMHFGWLVKLLKIKIFQIF